MVDQISSLGGYLSSPIAGAPGNIVKTAQFPVISASQTTATTGGDAVVGVRYTSPILVVDPSTKIVVYQLVDPTTGKVLNQYPSEKAIQEYKKADQQSGAPLTDATTHSPAGAIKAAPLPTSGVSDNSTAAPTPAAAPPAVATAAAPVSPSEKPV